MDYLHGLIILPVMLCIISYSAMLLLLLLLLLGGGKRFLEKRRKKRRNVERIVMYVLVTSRMYILTFLEFSSHYLLF